MPRQDGTGPSGNGPMSGRGNGNSNLNSNSGKGLGGNGTGGNRRRFSQDEPRNNNSIFSQMRNELSQLKNRILHLEKNQ